MRPSGATLVILSSPLPLLDFSYKIPMKTFGGNSTPPPDKPLLRSAKKNSGYLTIFNLATPFFFNSCCISSIVALPLIWAILSHTRTLAPAFAAFHTSNAPPPPISLMRSSSGPSRGCTCFLPRASTYSARVLVKENPNRSPFPFFSSTSKISHSSSRAAFDMLMSISSCVFTAEVLVRFFCLNVLIACFQSSSSCHSRAMAACLFSSISAASFFCTSNKSAICRMRSSCCSNWSRRHSSMACCCLKWASRHCSAEAPSETSPGIAATMTRLSGLIFTNASTPSGRMTYRRSSACQATTDARRPLFWGRSTKLTTMTTVPGEMMSSSP
mmetsp:Transcript_115679/g.367826  ORF Transcript_115679/g.367826 Transcript_115679/m.367826 type:complete len:328 (+) Transcript_115679:744-1727(+)